MKVGKEKLYKRQRGFALPTILIASFVMLVVLVTAAATVSSLRANLNTQYYNQLASEAAESGLARAQSCLQANEHNPQWGPGASGKSLTTSTDCNGSPLSGCSGGCYVVDTPRIKTSFISESTSPSADGSLTILITGRTELRLAADNSKVWRTITQTISRNDRYANQPQLGGGAGWKDNGHIGYMITQDGYLYGFGDNSNNQISDSPQSPILQPIKMTLPAGVTRVKKLVTSGQGASTICIIGSDDHVYCRGKPGGSGEQGLLNYSDVGWQKFVIQGSSAGGIAMSINGQGGDNLCVLSTYSYMFCAGDNSSYNGTYGLLGSGDTTSVRIPINQAVKFAIPGNPPVKKMYNQSRIVCAISNEDKLYCSGNNYYGTLGDGGSTNAATPQLYPLPSSRKAADVVSSYHEQSRRILHVLSTDGTIWGSGRNYDGELGNGNSSVQRTPVQFGDQSDFVSMIGGPTHFCGITSGGEVWCAGDNQYGQLGNGTCSNSSTPVKFALPAGEKAKAVTTGSNQHQWNGTMILTQSGNIYSAGQNEYGRFGSGTTGSGPDHVQCSVVKAQMPAGVVAMTLSTNDGDSVYFMGSNGRPYAMGRNNQGQLGDGTTDIRTTPQLASLPRTGVLY